ncbi:hypothetical protein FGRMN_5730 [Fusarium graminum]|nr:hypothetical protein FGRMN_5730 [Fusarium graminum]
MQNVSPGNSAPVILNRSFRKQCYKGIHISFTGVFTYRLPQPTRCFLACYVRHKRCARMARLEEWSGPGEKANIAGRDQIHLAWCYEVQYCGYRDLTQDAFGRRRNGPPPGAKRSTLYTRLPWPRFEPVASLPDQVEPLVNTLMISAVIREQQQTSQQILVEGCIFRLDVVKHHDRGDVDDYLLRGVTQDAEFPDAVQRERFEKQIEEQMEEERK